MTVPGKISPVNLNFKKTYTISEKLVIVKKKKCPHYSNKHCFFMDILTVCKFPF